MIVILVSLMTFGTASGVFAQDDQTNTYRNIGQGNFHLRILSLQNLMRPSQSSISFYDIERGDLNVNYSMGYGNVWNYQPDAYLVDGEWAHADLRLAYAIHKRVEIGFLLPSSYRHGGFLDSWIEGFHDAFGLGQRGRDEYPRDEVHIKHYINGKAISTIEGKSYGINDIPLFATWHVSPGDETWPAFRIQPSVSLPVGEEDEFEGFGRAIYAISLMAAKRLGASPHHLYAEAYISHADKRERWGIPINQEVYGGMLAWEFRWSSTFSWITQLHVMSAVARDFDEWSREAYHINVGFKKKIASDTALEFSLQENLFYFNNSADVGMHVAISTVF